MHHAYVREEADAEEGKKKEAETVRGRAVAKRTGDDPPLEPFSTCRLIPQLRSSQKLCFPAHTCVIRKKMNKRENETDSHLAALRAEAAILFSTANNDPTNSGKREEIDPSQQ